MSGLVSGATNSPPGIVGDPGVAKVWCRILAAGTLASPSYNVASITDNATGQRGIVFDVDFSSAVYAIAAAHSTASNDIRSIFNYTFAVGSLANHDILNNAGGAYVDHITEVVFFGDQ